MTDQKFMQPADWKERRKAVDISRSCIVQAPAGSGKTELLVQRILALLGVAETPEEVLSITFTRKAAGEMKLRLLQALERASDDNPPEEPHACETWERARSVLDRDLQKGWNLLQNPARLQLTTIDSFCSMLTRRMPWLARFGDQPKVTDDPADLYLLAAEALLSRLERGGAGQAAVERLLVHLDNRLPLLRELFVAMLGRRDQWLRHLMTSQGQDPRQLLEASLQNYVSSFLQETCDKFGRDICAELVELISFAEGNLEDDHLFAGIAQHPDRLDKLEFWLAVSHLLLTASGDVRKSVNKGIGFPADKTPLAQEMKSRVLTLLDDLREAPEIELLQAIRCLPATSYDQNQWQILESLIELLPLAVVELKDVFRLQGQVDFIEVSGAAYAALGSVSAPEDLLLQLDSRIRHILVDEFQDTSYAQYDLLTRLTAGWEPGDGRTLFVVGDPMQSIYRFREAEVGLYLRVCQSGLNSLPMDRVVLNTNFRSQASLVDWTNDNFGSLFPVVEDQVRGAVRYAHSAAHNPSASDAAITMHTFVERQDVAEAEKVVALVRESREIDPGKSIAVLVRSRNHLSAIVDALKKNSMRYQAQDIDPLIDRPVVQDLLSLTRAIQHLADRVAWLSILRAPWCGLTLDDLAKLCGKDSRSTIWQLLTQPADQVEMFEQVSPDGRQRLSRIMPILEQALRNRGKLSLRRLVESTWLSLGGPACVEEADLIDVRQVFSLLEEFETEGSLETLEKRLGKLYAAPDPQAGPELQLMTIHKAKGLEFDTVILPGLGRGVRSRDRDLLRWLEHTDYGLLLAPLPPITSEQQEPTYRAIGQVLQEKDDLETLRLLYVSATRAKSRLHLLGHVRLNRDGELKPLAGSLLSVLWPACEDDFSQNTCDVKKENPDDLYGLTLKRLPLHWRPPVLAGRLDAKKSTVRLASGGGHYLDEAVKSRRTEEGRVIGVVVHEWLERIAVDGLSKWPAEALEGQVEHFKIQLGLQGVPSSRTDACSAKVLECLTGSVNSSRGRWLLASHPEASCELALNGVLDGQLVRATIDRVFLDSEGVRWVVDYKTSSPSGLEDQGQFLQKELERYQCQLQTYAELVESLLPGAPVRTALYFPLFDGWIEAGS
jgi:ATP-dependent exoDNAse (exonuclease V) beta subunit